MSKYISLQGCRLHNLKNVDAQFPLGEITVVCGPSGCGKSTLVLDTLHGESKRRYLETLSPFAIDILGGKRNIPLNSAEGLPASIAIGPSRGEAPLRSYALSIAECDGGLRALFGSLAKPACPVCQKPMESFTREEIIGVIAKKEVGTKLQFFARIPSEKNSLDKLSALFLAQGFTRAMADGVLYSLADLTDDEKRVKPKEFFIIVDRVIVRENARTRIAEAVDGTLNLTHTEVTLDILGDGSSKREIYSTIPRCAAGHGEAPFTVEPALFSPYSKAGSCQVCSGRGIDEEDKPCPCCQGLKLNESVLNTGIPYTLNGEAKFCSWKNLLDTTFEKLPDLLKAIFIGKIPQKFEYILNSLQDRIQAINELGLGYLTAGRPGPTLSGGEMQRLRLASLSTGHLNGLLICLDEPASGLHHNDVEKLWKVFEKVQSRGNTLVLIEHHPEIISRADWIIEMGPGAGEEGGKVLFQGNREEVLNHPHSPTGNWIKRLRGAHQKSEKKVPSKKDSKFPPKNAIVVEDFHLYDMVPVSAAFPIQKFSVITGQSGSGKSTLLFENIAKGFDAGNYEDLKIEAQSILATGDFHGSKRSTVISAIGLNTLLRDLFAKLPEAKVRGYAAAKFSTHAPGGRCENCKGEGVIFDPTGYEETECPVCLGRRFRDEILEVRFKTLSIAEILNLEVGAAYKLFSGLKPFTEKLKPLVDTGLQYLRLGQTTNHLSGGERSRLRLSIALSKAKAPNTLFLFDEPARGLHEKDIQHLLELIRGLTEAGHTVIAIEHAQDFVDAADYVVELSR